jgi:hypothetical protein
MTHAKITPRTQLSGIREHYNNVETLTREEGKQMHGELTNIEKSRLQQVSPTAMWTVLLQKIQRSQLPPSLSPKNGDQPHHHRLI